jgi:site-specific DNA recombinase
VKTGYRDVRRPGFERAVEALLNQEIEALVVPKLDRLSRRGMGQVGLLDDLERVDGRIIFVGDGLDSSQPGARQIIAFLAEQARTESQNTGWRVAQFYEGARVTGKWVSTHPYGYMVENYKLKPHPHESLIVRRMIDDFLVGLSFRAIAQKLNDEGVPWPREARAVEAGRSDQPRKARHGTGWGYTTVRFILTNSVLCGWQTHKGRVVIGPEGEPIEFGEGIIEPAEYVRLQNEIERRTALVKHARKTERIGGKTGGGRPAKYLLTSFARCASCRRSAVAARWGGPE